MDLLISGYLNYEPYYGSVPADKGKRRIDVYNEHLEHVRHVEEDVLNLMMLRTSKPKKVDREGVYLNIRGKKIWYNCPELHSLWQEKKVYLRYDPDDLSSVRVYREDGSFIMTAPRCELEAKYGATQEEIARQQQLKNKYKRVVQELAATLLPDAPPEEAAALVARMAEENLAGPITPGGTDGRRKSGRTDHAPQAQNGGAGTMGRGADGHGCWRYRYFQDEQKFGWRIR